VSGLQWLGAAMLALPLVVLFAYTVREEGWREAFMMFLSAFGICAFIFCGAWLLAGDA